MTKRSVKFQIVWMILWQVPVVKCSQWQLCHPTLRIFQMWEVIKKNSSDINTTDVDFLFADTDLTLILNCKIYPLQMFQVTPFKVFSLCQYNWTASWRLITERWRCQPYPIIIVLFISIFIQNDGCDSNIFILLHFYTIVTVVFVSLLIKSLLN